MNINQPYNGIKCCPVCATNLETIWMALKLAMPLGAIQAPSARPIEPPAVVQKPKRAYRMHTPRPSDIPLEKKEEARRLKSLGYTISEISAMTGINPNTLPKIVLGIRGDPSRRPQSQPSANPPAA